MFTISAKLLHQVSAFRAEDSDFRYYLSAVHIERDDAGRVLLVATDGHRMLAAQDESALWTFKPGDTFILDFKIPGIKQALTRAAKSDSSRVQWDGQHLEVLERPHICAEGVLVSTYQVPSGHNTMMDARFPDWRRVIPPAKGMVLGHVGRINLELLEGLERFGTRGGVLVDIFTTGNPNSAAVVRIVGAPHVLAIIMPCGRDAKDVPAPMPEFATGRCWQKPADPQPAIVVPTTFEELEEATSKVQATATKDVAAWIDPDGALQAAGLLTVTT